MSDATGNGKIHGDEARLHRVEAEYILLRRDVTALSAGDAKLLKRIDEVSAAFGGAMEELYERVGECLSAVQTVLGRMPEKRERRPARKTRRRRK